MALFAMGGQADTLERSAGDWKAETAPLTFSGMELYTFMNGGAELYLEYGFERLESQRYARGTDEIGVDLYRMQDGAYGLFTFLRPATAEPVDLGDAAFLAGYYLLFVKGPFLCAVTAQSAFRGSREALLELAASIDSRLDGGARPPEILSLLPRRGRVGSTEKQLRGPIGLRSLSPKAADLFAGFGDGALAAYESNGLGGVLRWNDPATAERVWNRALDLSAGASVRRDRQALLFLGGGIGQPFFGAARTGAFVVFASSTERSQVENLIAALLSSVVHKDEIPESEKRNE
jgi:hypothetical protein